jgi:uncharacterized protein (TIRG00374 family)
MKTAMIVTIMGWYYSALTPTAVGGQPAQIYHMYKGGVDTGSASGISFTWTMLANFLNALISFVLLMFVLPAVRGDIPIWLSIFAYIGMGINLGVVVLGLVMSNSKRLARKFTRLWCRVGVWLRLIKNYRLSYVKLAKGFHKYRQSFGYMLKHRWRAAHVVITILLTSFLNASMPFFVCLALGVSPTIDWTTYMVTVIFFFVYIQASSYFPLPGGSGMAEVSFFTLFGGAMFFGANIAWGMLGYRIIVYYAIILVGFMITVFSVARKFTKREKAV